MQQRRPQLPHLYPPPLLEQPEDWCLHHDRPAGPAELAVPAERDFEALEEPGVGLRGFEPVLVLQVGLQPGPGAQWELQVAQVAQEQAVGLANARVFPSQQ
jgi:hypothetical protein